MIPSPAVVNIDIEKRGRVLFKHNEHFPPGFNPSQVSNHS